MILTTQTEDDRMSRTVEHIHDQRGTTADSRVFQGLKSY